VGHTIQIHRLHEKTGIAQFACRPTAQEPAHLVFDLLTPPEGLSLHSAERTKVTLRIEELLDTGGTEGTDQFVFEILNTNMKTQTFHVDPGLWCTGSNFYETAPEHGLLARVTETGDRQVHSLGTKEPQVTADRLGAPDGQDDDPIGIKIPTMADGKGLECDLVTDALHQRDGVGTAIFQLGQGSGRRLCRGGGAGGIAG